MHDSPPFDPPTFPPQPQGQHHHSTWADAKDVAAGYKVCTRCSQRRPLSSFNADPTGRGGVRSRCVECERVIGRKRYGTPAVKTLYANIRGRGDYGRVARRTAAAWRAQDHYRAMTADQLASELQKLSAAGKRLPRALLGEIRRR